MEGLAKRRGHSVIIEQLFLPMHKSLSALFAYYRHMMTQLVDELTTLGFSERIAQAYVLLAQKGEMTAREIGERFSLARPTAHDVMMSLVHHGLARAKSGGKEKTFIMEPPMMIREKLEEQRRTCASRLERFESLLPNLQALSSIGGGLCSAVRYIEGVDAIACRGASIACGAIAQGHAKYSRR